MPITILQLAEHRGAKPNANGAFSADEIERVGLPFMGGCEVCGATIAAYNACPSKTGYLRCLNDCIGDNGYETCEQAESAERGSDYDDEILPEDEQ
jgi:hypothetical protein